MAMALTVLAFASCKDTESKETNQIQSTNEKVDNETTSKNETSGTNTENSNGNPTDITDSKN